ncbi:MAG: N-acetyl-gamma-glutamyl-phosphate reductase [Alphaproteobacteria bacterium]|nr:N-acetyl-gamma-glutamyl-phosphate reductase [Alphaproteobacteria bacterium]MBL7098372.1 N-acetyl-gamma-glutamyl-phosphate reductase [Alphaproteobacteria bacterium]
MGTKIFVDGAAGTTGLEIRERLAGRHEFAVTQLSDSDRKDVRARKKALNEADIVILCLPDDAARESVSLIENAAVRVIDASTAHRVAEGWVFGFPEFEPGNYEAIAGARRVTNPGCWSTGFLALVRPLVRAGLIPAETPLNAHGVSGYSGGGKTMIEEFEKKDSPAYVETVARAYAMQLGHKHVAEMTARAGLQHPPVFMPSVGRYYRGMIVEVGLNLWALKGSPAAVDLHAALTDTYKGRPFVEVASPPEAAGVKTLDAEMLKNTNKMKLYVFSNEKTKQVRLTAVLDNLGKGASGAAVQSLNIMAGLSETAGLV